MNQIGILIISLMLIQSAFAASFDCKKILSNDPRLTAGWDFKLEGGGPIETYAPGSDDKLCQEVKAYMNRVAPNWTSDEDMAYMKNYCTTTVRLFPGFSEPPWTELDPRKHEDLIVKLLRYRFEGARAYFGLVRPSLEKGEEYYREEARRFIESGGRLQYWKTRLVEFATDPRDFVDKRWPSGDQHVIQLRFAEDYSIDKRFQNLPCPLPKWGGAVFIVTEDLKGPDPRIFDTGYGALSGSTLFFHDGNLVLLQDMGFEIHIDTRDSDGDFSQKCTLLFPDYKFNRWQNEKLICTNNELSSMDEKLSRLYSETLKKVPDPEKLKEQQRNWLKYRDEKSMNADRLTEYYQYQLIQLKRSISSGKQDELEISYASDPQLCKQILSEYSSFADCKLNDAECFTGQWRINKPVGISKISSQDLATNQYGYTKVDVTYPSAKPYAIVYLEGFQGDRNPRLLETWKVDAKELQSVTNLKPNPLPYEQWMKGEHQIKRETLESEFGQLLSHGEKLSDDSAPVWSPLFSLNDDNYVVNRECIGGWAYGGYYDCHLITKVTVKQINPKKKSSVVCEFSRPSEK